MPDNVDDNTKAAGEATTKVGFFEDDTGNPSSMRLMSFVALLAAIILGFLTLYYSKDGSNLADGVLITFGFLISAFAPKTVQKFAEQKIPVKK